MNTIAIRGGSLRGRALTAVLAAVALLAAAPALLSAEYFVAVRGSDAADGLSPAGAFGTIARGISALKPGDTLTILPGTYFEAVSARLCGEPDAPVTIRAQRPGTVLLRGDVDAPEFRRVEGLRHTYRADFAPRAEGVGERSTFRMYEPMLTVGEVELSVASFYQDEQAGRLYVHTSDSAPPSSHALSISVTNGFGLLLTPPPGSKTVHDVVLDGLSFTGYQSRDVPAEPGSRSRWGLHIANAERVVVRRCTAFLSNGGIYLLASRDSVVEDCRCFGNFSRFQPLGNNILGWSVANTTFRRNVVEAFPKETDSLSQGDIAFYGGGENLVNNLMEDNLAIRAWVFIKGAYGEDTVQRRNVAAGRGAGYYRFARPSELLLVENESEQAQERYADPINHDYRLQSDAPMRGQGPDGADPGPHQYADEVFFVSPTGDDAAPGTSLKLAWRTLGHAAQTARPGQTVYITAGEYREALVPAQSGSADRPIQFLRRGRDRVILNGEGRLPVGVDLRGRSHVVIRGLAIRDFTRHGIQAETSEGLRVEQTVITGSGQSAVAASGVTGLVFTRNLVRGSGAAGLWLANSPQATVTGNILDIGGGPRIECDAASLETLWSDRNAFPPGQTEMLVVAAGAVHQTLAAWQAASGMDPASLAVAVGYRDSSPEQGDFALGTDSPLIGRGPDAAIIGPHLRFSRDIPLPITDLEAVAVTDSTATIQWWTPTRAAASTLHWGEDPDCGNRVDSPAGTFHTVSLVGLKRGTGHFFRVTTEARGAEPQLAPWEVPAAESATAPAEAGPLTFETAATAAAPRVFHVAVTGDDTRSGLSAEEPWRSIAHAAGQVRAGDTVLIHEGRYEEYVLVRATGTATAPITFRAAPGETVWMEGSDRARATAFRLASKHCIHIEGIHFRHFRSVPHAGDVINISGGSGHAVRRCFYDGRESDGYMGNFIRAHGTAQLLVENCVMINGMGEGLVLSRCPEVTVRHCVFYNNFIRALTAWQYDAALTITLSHNLFCDTIPEKTGNAFIRLSHLESLRSEHNGYFARTGPTERYVVEAANIAGQPVGHQGHGAYYGQKLLLAEVQQAGQERGSFFGNPRMPLVAEMLPPNTPRGEWRKLEMHWDGQAFRPWSFADFMCDPAGRFGRAPDGAPIGLDPAAFR